MLEKLKKMMLTASGVAVLAVAVFCFNIIASKLFFRADVTQDKVFSLSKGTIQFLGKLEEEISIKLYFSRSMRDLPPAIKTFATRVEEVLREYVANSRGNVRFVVIDPKPDTDEEEWARKAGIQGVRLPSGEEMFFGVSFVMGDRESAIPYLDPRREEQLEYDLTEALVNIRRREKPTIGIASWLPVTGGSDPMAMMRGGREEDWVFVSELRKSADVKVVETTATEIPAEIGVLIVFHPKEPSESFEYAVDQFLMRGGRLIVAVDPFSRTDLALNGRQAQMMGQMPKSSSNMPKIFGAIGVKYNPDNLVGDIVQPTQINAGTGPVNYPYFISLSGDSLLKTPISGSLHQMLFAEGGEVEKADGSQFSFEPLLQTSGESGTASAATALFQQPQDLARDLKVENKKRILAAMVRGKFKSAFSTAPPPPAGADPQKTKPPGPHIAEATAETTVVVVADTDFAFDQNAVDKMQFINQVLVRPRNDNLAFIFNTVDVLGGSEDLINIRSKGRIARPFSRLVAIERNAQARWKEEEEKLNNRLTELQKKLNELQAQRTDGSRLNLTPEQQREIEKFRAEELDVRRKRREVRKNLREDIEALGKRLMVANMVIVPLAVSGLGIGVFMNRSRRRRSSTVGGHTNG